PALTLLRALRRPRGVGVSEGRVPAHRQLGAGSVEEVTDSSMTALSALRPRAVRLQARVVITPDVSAKPTTSSVPPMIRAPVGVSPRNTHADSTPTTGTSRENGATWAAGKRASSEFQMT